MKIKNKKTILAITAVLLIAVVGVTFAYFQSSASFKNLFTAGTYKVVTREVFESPDNWAPGEEMPKTITSTNEGTIPAAVRVSYTEQWLDEEENDITSQVANGTAIINLDNTNDWTKEGNYYYYKYILEPEETTSSFIKSVTLNPNLNGITCTPSNDGSTQTCTSNNPILGGTYKLIITKETVQADRYQEVWNTNVSIIEKPASSITYLTRQVEGQITPGDVIGIGETEDFYVLSSDNSPNGKTVLLAKYNLLVGYSNNESTNYEDTYISPSTPGYGLQNVDAIGYEADYYSTVDFSSTKYWDDGGLKSEYAKDLYGNPASYSGNPYPYVYDNTYITAPDFSSACDDSTNCFYTPGYSIAYYVEEYKTKLIEMGAPSTITGRLLSYEEADDAQSIEDNGTSIIFNDTDYWLGSASPFSSSSSYVLVVGDAGAVRPVIEIPTSELQ